MSPRFFLLPIVLLKKMVDYAVCLLRDKSSCVRDECSWVWDEVGLVMGKGCWIMVVLCLVKYRDFFVIDKGSCVRGECSMILGKCSLLNEKCCIMSGKDGAAGNVVL